MELLTINAEIIHRFLPPDSCIELMDSAMRQVSRREAALPLRTAMPMMNGKGALGNMPGYLQASGDRPDVFGIKLISLYPDNPAEAGLPSHLGLVILYEADNGIPLAILDADVITAIRTAAASGLATRELARSDSAVLAIIGTGEEARTHIPAMLAVRDLETIRVWGRNRDKAAALCEEFGHLDGVAFEAVDTVEAAVADADIVCTVTASPTPVLKGAWLPSGVHVNLVGSSIASAREVDSETVARGKFYIDYIESTMNQAGEFLKAMEDGVVGEDHIVGEIGDVLLGNVAGRQCNDEITIYKSLGVAAQDLASAWYVYQRARASGLGQTVRM